MQIVPEVLEVFYPSKRTDRRGF